METRSVVSIETVVNERKYTFQVPFGAPYDEAYQVANQMMLAIHELRKQAEEAAGKKPEDVEPEVVNLN